VVPSVEALTIEGIAPPLPVLLLRRLEDFYLHLLPSEQPLELPNPLLGLSQSAGRDDIFIRGHGRGRPRLDPALPLPDHPGLDVQLPAHLRQGLVPFHELLDDSPLELDREDPPVSISVGRPAAWALALERWFETARGAVVGYSRPHTGGLGVCLSVRPVECASRGCQERHVRFESRRPGHGGSSRPHDRSAAASGRCSLNRLPGSQS
jgi:hypothetical protein